MRAIDALAHLNAAEYFVDRHCEHGREQLTVLRSASRTLTYGELAQLAAQAGNVFTDASIERENRVVLLLPDDPLFAAAFFGLIRIGAVPVPVSSRLSLDEYLYIFADCRPTGAVIGVEHIDQLRTIREATSFPRHVWVVNGADPSDEFAPFERSLDAADRECPVQRTHRDDMALIQYTSGSTGVPKGVVHLHRGLLALADGFGRRLQLTTDDVCFSAAKLSFGYGLGNSILFPSAAGASAVLLPGPVSPYAAFETIQRFRPTVFFGVPSLYAAMLKVPGCDRHFDLSSLRLCVSAGEHLSASVFERWRDTFGFETVDGIGTTECLHIVIAGTPGRIIPGSTGTPVPGYDIEIREEDGRPVSRGECGHLWVKGPSNAARYWNKHDETMATMVGSWTRTGDLFYQDDRDYFFFVGRADDLIKVHGYKVSPIEIEETLLEHPGVKECAVVGRLTADGVTLIAAYVCRVAGAQSDRSLKRDLRAHLQRRLAPHKQPETIELVEALPRTTTGKIARFRLRSAGASLAQL